MLRTTIAIFFAMLCVQALADEGMWTIDNFPAEQVSGRYGAVINDQWLRSA